MTDSPKAAERILPRYPIYIPSKGRADVCYTAQELQAQGVPFTLIVEPQDERAYVERFGSLHVHVLPFSNLGLGSIPARNYIWQHALERGYERHWTLDDNMRGFWRHYRGKRIRCDAGVALRVCEDFTDRYTNVAISGLNYYMFVPDDRKILPVQINCHVYSCMLIRNDLPYRWRGRYNEDTDLCLQVLAGGWCTILLNTFLAHKMRTQTMKGGNSTELYAGDGRLKMARSLERVWPGVVTTKRRFQRPQHYVAFEWEHFDTPLQLREGLSLDELAADGPNEYGMDLAEREPVRDPRLRQMLEDWRVRHEV